LSPVKRPVINGKKMMRFLERNDYVLIRSKGSHFHFKRMDGRGYLITVAVHGKDKIKPDTLDSIIEFYAKNEELSIDEVRQALLDM
jgi:predicted RNA binding protein YcfA (HicA-like mRNA interferase family)